MSLYWDIGRMIVKRQKDKTWGKAVVERLAQDRHKSFPGIRGFSWRNIGRMRNLYLNYCNSPKLPSLMAVIGWTHNTVILEKCKKAQEREFYIPRTRKLGWTVNVFIHQIENQGWIPLLIPSELYVES
jgi:predicted nuclease of restriction endonuclease-like (RecB) superfamily